ncbi:MAG: type II secretion system major pseudopilin GspG [Phycisphaerales bacterium]|nr:type II secretion system major pseudopilin GspG [Phycisphaerales bacterium]
MMRRAFSLFEMLIVLAIIGLLAALVAPRLAGVFSGGQVKQTKAQIQLLSGAVAKFQLDMLRVPTEEEGLHALIEKPTDADEKWEGPYLERRSLPKDGWNHDFVYKTDPEFDYIIISLGSDGREGGDGDAADLDNRS